MTRTLSTLTTDIVSYLVTVKVAYLNILYLSSIGMFPRLRIALALLVSANNINSAR